MKLALRGVARDTRFAQNRTGRLQRGVPETLCMPVGHRQAANRGQLEVVCSAP
jgi:hypothetical protein